MIQFSVMKTRISEFGNGDQIVTDTPSLPRIRMGAVADWLDEYDEPRRAEVFRLRMRRLEATA